MADVPKISRPLPASLPQTPDTDPAPANQPISVEGAKLTMAEAADIRRPTAQRARDEESGAQKNPRAAPPTTVPAEIRARADFLRKTAASSAKIEGRGEAFLNFLKQRPSDEEAHLLVAEAQLMASLSQPRKNKRSKKRRLREALKKALGKTIYLLDSVTSVFRKKP